MVIEGREGVGRYVPPERGTVGVGRAALMQSAVMSWGTGEAETIWRRARVPVIKVRKEGIVNCGLLV